MSRRNAEEKASEGLPIFINYCGGFNIGKQFLCIFPPGIGASGLDFVTSF